MTPIEQRYEDLKQAYINGSGIDRDLVNELFGMIDQLVDERKRMRKALERMTAGFADVRRSLNGINQIVR